MPDGEAEVLAANKQDISRLPEAAQAANGGPSMNRYILSSAYRNRLRVRMHGIMHTRPPTGETAAAAKHARTQPPHQRHFSRCSSVRHSHERRNKKMTSTKNNRVYAYMLCKFLPSPLVLRVCPHRERLRVRINDTPLLAWAKSFTNEGTSPF